MVIYIMFIFDHIDIILIIWMVLVVQMLIYGILDGVMVMVGVDVTVTVIFTVGTVGYVTYLIIF